MELAVCALSQVERVARATGARRMLTVISEGTQVNRPAQIAEEDHLYLAFNDVVEPAKGLVAPNEDHIAKLIGFALAWNRQAPMIVHCWAGISRSTAAAFIIAQALTPDADPLHLAWLLRIKAPSATPNARMIALADKFLGKDGAMLEAVRSIGRGANAYEGTPFRIPVGETALQALTELQQSSTA